MDDAEQESHRETGHTHFQMDHQENTGSQVVNGTNNGGMIIFNLHLPDNPKAAIAAIDRLMDRVERINQPVNLNIDGRDAKRIQQVTDQMENKFP